MTNDTAGDHFVHLLFLTWTSISLDQRECTFVISMDNCKLLLHHHEEVSINLPNTLNVCHYQRLRITCCLWSQACQSFYPHRRQWPQELRWLFDIEDVKVPKTQSDSVWAVTWQRCFCRGPGRPSFQTLTPRSCSLQCWHCRCHSWGICSYNRPHLKEKRQVRLWLALFQSFKITVSHSKGFPGIRGGLAHQDASAWYSKHLKHDLTHILSLETHGNTAR